jgi:dihydrofolate reductase
LNKGKKYVVSSNLKKAPWENTTIVNNDFIREVEKLKREDGGYILVQGSSSLLKPLLEEGLVDELRLLVNPAIIGTGERPFLEYININLGFARFQQLDKNVILLIYNPTKNVST